MSYYKLTTTQPIEQAVNKWVYLMMTENKSVIFKLLALDFSMDSEKEVLF